MASSSKDVNPQSDSPSSQAASRGKRKEKKLNLGSVFNTFDPFSPNRSALNLAASDASNAASGQMPSHVGGGYSSDFINKHRCFEMIGNSEFNYDNDLPSDSVKCLKPYIPLAIECCEQNNPEGFTKESLLLADKKTNVFLEEPESDDEFSFANIKTLQVRPAEQNIPLAAVLDQSVLAGKDTPEEVHTEVKSITSAVVSASGKPESAVTETCNEENIQKTEIESAPVESDVPEKTRENCSDAESVPLAAALDESVLTGKDSPGEVPTAVVSASEKPESDVTETRIEESLQNTEIAESALAESIVPEKTREENPSDAESAPLAAALDESAHTGKDIPGEVLAEVKSIPFTTVPEEHESIVAVKDQGSLTDTGSTPHTPVVESKGPAATDKAQKELSTEKERISATVSEELKSIQFQIDSVSKQLESIQSRIDSAFEELKLSQSRLDSVSEQFKSIQSPSIRASELESTEKQIGREFRKDEENILVVASTECKLVESVAPRNETEDEPFSKAGSTPSGAVPKHEVHSAVSGKQPREVIPDETGSTSFDVVPESKEAESVNSITKTREDPPCEVKAVSSAEALETDSEKTGEDPSSEVKGVSSIEALESDFEKPGEGPPSEAKGVSSAEALESDSEKPAEGPPSEAKGVSSAETLETDSEKIPEDPSH